MNERLEEAISGFCDSLRTERNMSEHTIRAYRTDLRTYKDWAERRGIDGLSLTYRQMRGYLVELDRAGYEKTTANRRLSALRSFFAWACVVGYAESNPAELLQGPKQKKSLPRAIRSAEMQKLLAVWSPVDNEGNPRELSPEELRNQALLEFLYACGARISEASGLLVSNVDLSLLQVKVLGKGNKERIIPLHDTAMEVMHLYLAESRPQLLGGKTSEFFFVSNTGKQLSADGMRLIYKKALAAAGLDLSLSPHAMRHTFATDVLDGGADLRSVQEMLGHSSLSTTQIYTHLSVDRLKEAHRKSLPRG